MKSLNLELLRKYCLSKKGVTEDFPFDEETIAFRVAGKIFVLTNIYSVPLRVNLKCDPERAIELREQYECITPGWHMNKKHWNTVEMDGSLNSNFIQELLDHSYNETYKSLKKSEKDKLDSI